MDAQIDLRLEAADRYGRVNMNERRHDALEAILQESNIWIKALSQRLDCSHHVAYIAFRAVLHALRDRIGRDHAANLGSQLPTLIRGIYFEGWDAGAAATKERHMAQFLDHVRRELHGTTVVDPDAAVRSVFEVMWQKMDPGEIAKLIRLFPVELRQLWPVTVVPQ
jgi:uncharacterized protein (DUF2267 family)